MKMTPRSKNALAATKKHLEMTKREPLATMF
jgi:hypothetical protein